MSMQTQQDLDQLAINTIRFLSVDAVEAAQSGHPGTAMALAPLSYVLWTRFLRFDPQRPEWPNRDRFILSCGHVSMLLYSLLYLTGYDLSLDDLKQFRQWGSPAAGHPERGLAPGIETTTGPLGQGFANGVGMAIAQHYLATQFNQPGHTILDHDIYVFVSDGDLMEGVSAEAASLAGHLQLDRLIYFYDDNHITIDGPTELAFTERVDQRFEGYGWFVQRVDDANDLDEIECAIEAARAESTRPSLITVRSHIGFGSPGKQDTASAHGAPLGADEVRATKDNLGWPHEPSFHVPEDALAHFRQAVQRGAARSAEWDEQFSAYQADHPDLAVRWTRMLQRELPDGWDHDLPVYAPSDKPIATRKASGQALNAIATHLPELIGGSADLAPSNNTLIADSEDFSVTDRGGRNLRFGVREHAMGGVLSGMAAHGWLRPYGATFLVFSDYMRPSVRLAALMELPTIYVYTHDSIGLGEDGPTHQPIEHLASLRAIPGLVVIRPGDANEAVAAWCTVMEHRDGPTTLVLTRQSLPVLAGTAELAREGVSRGGYVLADAVAGSLELILIATGSEVAVALKARAQLEADGTGVRVVSLPSWELFDAQPQSYRDLVLPPLVSRRVAIEAASPMGWERYVGSSGRIIGIDRFGASAPAQVLMEQYGITAEHLVGVAQSLIGGTA